MKVSKETKILAVLLALFLLIGIGCGAAVAVNENMSSVPGALIYVIDTVEADTVSAENAVPVTTPLSTITLVGVQAASGAAGGLITDMAIAEAHVEPLVIA